MVICDHKKQKSIIITIIIKLINFSVFLMFINSILLLLNAYFYVILKSRSSSRHALRTTDVVLDKLDACQS